jgi:hypothetical protein
MVVDQLDQVKDKGSHEQVDTALKIEMLEDQFNNIRTKIINELSTKPGITVQVLLNQLTCLPLSLRKEYESSIAKRIRRMRSETQVYELFIIHLNPLISFIDYGLIEYVIKKFGSDALKRDMRSYCSDMIVFMKETTIKQLIEADHFPGQTEIPPKFSLIEAKIDEDASKCTLEQLNRLRKRYCSEVKLSNIVFHLVAVVESNSFIVRWLVPSALVSDVVRSTENVSKSFYREYKITFLILDGIWLFISETEIDTIWSQLHVNDTKLKDQFHTMYKQIVHRLEVEQITGHQLSSYLKESLKCHRSTSDLLSHELLNHELPVSVVDFRILTAAIEGFGSDCLKSVMSSYSKYISMFLKKATTHELRNSSAIQIKPSGYSIVKCRIKKKPSQYKLDKLFSFRTRFCMITDFSELCLIMDEVSTEMSGSFTVSWLVPPAFISAITKFTRNVDQSFYQEYKITSLTLDGMWLCMSKSEIDAMWSRLHVSDTKFKDQFHAMYKQIVYELEVAQITEHELSSYFAESLECHQSTNDSLSLELLNHELPVSVVEFRVLAATINKRVW